MWKQEGMRTLEAYPFSFVSLTGSLTGLASNASERLQSIIDRVMLQNR